MHTEIKLSATYRSTRKFLHIVCWLSIFWSVAQFDINLINITYIGNIELKQSAFPFLLFSLIIYLFGKSVLEYAMQPLKDRHHRLAIIDFKVGFYFSIISIIALAVSIESRSITAVLLFMSLSIPFMIVVEILTCLIFGLIFLYKMVFDSDNVRSIAGYVISLMLISGVYAKLLIIVGLFSISFIHSFTTWVQFEEFIPSKLGLWSMTVVFSLLIVVKTTAKVQFDKLFGFVVYDHNKKTFFQFNKYGEQCGSLGNVKRKW